MPKESRLISKSDIDIVDGEKSNVSLGVYEAKQAAWVAARPLFSDMVRDGVTNSPIYIGEFNDIEEEDFLMRDIIGTKQELVRLLSTHGPEWNYHIRNTNL